MFYKAGFTLTLIFDIWAIYHLWNGSLETGPKVLWTLLIFMLPLMGPCLYVFLGRARSTRTARR